MDEHGIGVTTRQSIVQRPSRRPAGFERPAAKNRQLTHPASVIVLDADHGGRDVGLPSEGALDVCAMNHVAKCLLKDENEPAA